MSNIEPDYGCDYSSNKEHGYSIKFGKFDHKLGPICLLTQKNETCSFANQICSGYNCPLMVDTINTKEHNTFFQKNDYFYQAIKIKIHNPEKRGATERFVIVIQIPKGLGLLKQEILENLKKLFIKFVEDHNLEVTNKDMDELNQLQNSFLELLESNLNATAIADEMHFLRERLNIISINLQLTLAELEEISKEQIKNNLSESLITLYEIVGYIDKKKK